jgi:hypothetical protein
MSLESICCLALIIIAFSLGGFKGESDGFNPSGGFPQGGYGGQGTNPGFGNNVNNLTGQGMNTAFGNNANSTTGQFSPGSQGFTGGSGLNSGNSNQQYTGGSGQLQQPGSTGFGGGGNQNLSSGFGNQHTSGGSGQWQPQTNFGGNQPQTGGNQQYLGGSTNQGNINTNYYNGNGFNPNNPYIPTTTGYVPATGQFINQGQTMQNYNGMMGSDIPKFPGPKQGSGQQQPKGSVPDIITSSRPSPRFGQNPRGRGGPRNPR